LYCIAEMNNRLFDMSVEDLIGACRPSGCTMASGVVGVVVVVVIVGGDCNHSQMRTTKCACLIFGVRIGLDPS